MFFSYEIIQLQSAFGLNSQLNRLELNSKITKKGFRLGIVYIEYFGSGRFGFFFGYKKKSAL